MKTIQDINFKDKNKAISYLKYSIVKWDKYLYDKTTKDLLQNIPIPTSSGYSNILINKGNISNKGLELALNFDVISNDKISKKVFQIIDTAKKKAEQVAKKNLYNEKI